MTLTTRLFLEVSTRGVAKPRHTRARAQATFACVFACQSFKLAPHAKESARDQKRRALARAFLRAE